MGVFRDLVYFVAVYSVTLDFSILASAKSLTLSLYRVSPRGRVLTGSLAS